MHLISGFHFNMAKSMSLHGSVHVKQLNLILSYTTKCMRSYYLEFVARSEWFRLFVHVQCMCKQNRYRVRGGFCWTHASSALQKL